MFKHLITAMAILPGAAWAQTDVTPFAANVTRHVMLHELAHAIFREFNVPMLGNEENMADSFATYYVSTQMRDAAAAIITARAQSWMYEDKAVEPTLYDHKGEHELDIRRSYRTLCLYYGHDPAEHADVVEFAGFSDRDLADCSDIAPEQAEDWARVLTPLRQPGGAAADRVSVIYGDGPMKDAMMASGVIEEVAAVAREFDWAADGITLHFDHCDQGAYWSRSERRILLCDAYVARFVRQGEALGL